MKQTSINLLCLIGLLSSCVSPSQKNTFVVEEVAPREEKSNLYFSIGQSYQSHGRIEDAIENYQEAISLDPGNHKAHFAMGKLLLKKQFIKEGIAEIKKAVSLDKKYTEARNFLAYFYYNKLKKFYKAKILIDESARDLTYLNQEETWALKLKIDNRFLGKKALMLTAPKVLALKAKSCVHRLDIAKTLYKMSLYEKALASTRLADRICFSKKNKNRIALLKGLIFVKRSNYLVAEKILSGVSPDTESFEKVLRETRTAIRKKINSGM